MLRIAPWNQVRTVASENQYNLGDNPPPRIPVANEGLGWDPLLKT